eukprot:1924756-Rhodomonas_salina.2
MARFLDKQLELILGTHCDSGSEVDICPGFHAPEHVYSCKGHTRQTTGEHYGMPVTQLNNTDPPTYVFADFLYSPPFPPFLFPHSSSPGRGQRGAGARGAPRHPAGARLCGPRDGERGDPVSVPLAGLGRHNGAGRADEDGRVQADDAHGVFALRVPQRREPRRRSAALDHLLRDLRLHFGLELRTLLPLLAGPQTVWAPMCVLRPACVLRRKGVACAQEVHEFPDLGWDMVHVFECIYDFGELASPFSCARHGKWGCLSGTAPRSCARSSLPRTRPRRLSLSLPASRSETAPKLSRPRSTCSSTPLWYVSDLDARSTLEEAGSQASGVASRLARMGADDVRVGCADDAGAAELGEDAADAWLLCDASHAHPHHQHHRRPPEDRSADRHRQGRCGPRPCARATQLVLTRRSAVSRTRRHLALCHLVFARLLLRVDGGDVELRHAC